MSGAEVLPLRFGQRRRIDPQNIGAEKSEGASATGPAITRVRSSTRIPLRERGVRRDCFARERRRCASQGASRHAVLRRGVDNFRGCVPNHRWCAKTRKPETKPRARFHRSSATCHCGTRLRCERSTRLRGSPLRQLPMRQHSPTPIRRSQGVKKAAQAVGMQAIPPAR